MVTDHTFASALPTFVGRAGELATMVRALDDARAGRSRTFLLVGEPGIGKTRLCDEVTALAADRDMPVLWGRAWEAGGAPAYWLWLDVLGGVVRLLDDAALRDTLGDAAALLAELVPEIRARAIAVPAVAPPPPDEARFRLCRAVVALVRRASAPAGLVLVFDDLHSADRSSLLLLYALARELRSMRVLLLATCRDVEARLVPEASELINRFAREGTTLSLGPLDRAAVEALLARHAGGAGPIIDARLFERTQGNPLFLQEMLRLLQEEGREAVEAGVVPSGVRDVIRQRLDRLPGDSRPLIELGAVAGDEIRPALLAAASGRDATEIGVAIATATRAGVLAERAGRPRFSHALVREVLYRELSPEQRRGLHERIGRALETLSGGVAKAGSGAPAPLPYMELAHHAMLGPASGVARAVEFAVLAAGRAVELAAYEEGVAVLERASAAVEAAGGPAALRARVCLALGETRIRSGEASAGQQLCAEAATLARALGDGELLAKAALTYGRVFSFGVMDPVLVALLEEALEALPAGDSPTRARLLARLGAAMQPAPSTAEPISVAREAIATARRLGDRRVLLETLHDGLSALMDVVEPRERLPLNREVEALAAAEGDRERLLRTHARLVVDHLALGELPEADARIDTFEALARELRVSWMMCLAALFRSIRAATHGRFAEADALAEEAARLGRPERDPAARRLLILHREGLLRVTERHDELLAHEPLARQERSSYRFASTWQAVGAAASCVQMEDLGRARTYLSLMADDMRPPQGSTDNVFALFSMAESALLVGDAALVEELRTRLLPLADQYVMLGLSQMYWGGPVTRLLGGLAARLERWDEADRWYQDAMARLQRLGALPHLARVQYEYARCRLARNTADGRRDALPLLAAARQQAVALGMTGLLRLIELRDVRDVRDLGATPDAEAVAPGPAPAQPLAGAPLALTLEGEYWTVTTAGGRTFRLKDSLGLQYLARLLAEPSREIHVLELVAAGNPGMDGGMEGSPIDTGDAGELLDQDARADYRRRLDELRETAAEAERFGDAARAGRAREEIAFLAAELGRAVGLGGRGRRAGSAAERARSAVQRRIKNALQRLGEGAPELAPLLARTVKTGNFCVFRPDAR